MARLALSEEEKSWLQTACPYFTPEYLDYLEAFRFKPDEQVSLDFIVEETTADGVELGKLDLEIKGGWAATILYEVRLCCYCGA